MNTEGESIGAAIHVEETLHVGTETFVDSVSPQGRYAVVFENDGATGYCYALNTSREGNPIVDALHIYDVKSVVERGNKNA
jgi:hypothetical protein